MKVEITHDILAQKVFAKLDAGKKELLEIKGLIESRCEQDSLLNRKEMKRVKPFLAKIDLTEKQEKFIKRSRIANIVNRTTNFSILIVPIIFFLLFRSNQLVEARQEQQELLSSYVTAKFDNKDQVALTQLKRYIEHPLSKTENILPFYMEMAALNLKSGDTLAAEANLQEAIDEASPGSDNKKYYQVKKVQFFLDINDVQEAQKLLDTLTNTASESTSGQTPLQLKEMAARMLNNLGKPDEAKAEYEEILAALPPSDSAARNRILENHAVICLAINQLEVAVADYIKTLRNNKLPLRSPLNLDSIFQKDKARFQIAKLLVIEKNKLKLPLDALVINALNDMLLRLDPMAAIIVDTLSANMIAVYDDQDTVEFQISGTVISCEGKKRFELQFPPNSPTNRILAATSSASFDAITTLNNNLSYGAFQWNLGLKDGRGELPALLQAIKQLDSIKFYQYFKQYQLDVSDDTNERFGFLEYDGKKINTTELKQIFQTPKWAFIFWKAAQDPIIMEAQRNQMMDRLDSFRRQSVGGTSIANLITSEHGNAVLLAYSLVRPEDITKRLRLAITAARDNLSDEKIIEEFITSWKEVGSPEDVDFRLSKLDRWRLKRTAKSF